MYQVAFAVRSEARFEDFCETLFCHGGDDATVCVRGGEMEVYFERAASSMTEAVQSAAWVVTSSGGEITGIKIG